MPTVFMVQADSQAECAAELSRMCAAFDLRPLLPPTRSTGTERWLARATAKAPDLKSEAVPGASSGVSGC